MEKIYKRILLTLSVKIFFIGFAYGQENNIKEIKKNTVYTEFLGTSATVASIHYDRIIKKFKKSYFDLGLGLGYFPPVGAATYPNYGIAGSFNWTTGINNNHFEVGIGLTYSSGFLQETHGSDHKTMEALMSSFRIGYKYQKPEGGIFFRVGLTPLVKLKEFSSLDDGEIFYKFWPLIGIGAGYTF